ncbi:unnamed protein product [Oppiella nova]|uniref:Nanos-type domain-containing protein n=1 Tax=Oppiella nova TaxID=334625 RepID=A0A7R9MIM1_9ACAR|nr:unnamed protein product [Oppiella nova]CAG2176906.1 unnamed protein product [Oppiella nova]
MLGSDSKGQSMNSYYGFNSLAKTWSPLNGFGANPWSPTALNVQNSRYFFSGPKVGRNVWSDWPSLEESVHRRQLLPPAPIPAPNATIQWTTNFWNNITGANMGHGLGTGANDDTGMRAISPALNGFGYQTDVRGRALSPIGSPPKWSPIIVNDCLPVQPKDDHRVGRPMERYVQPRIRRRMPTLTECVFCKNNNEPEEYYKTHILKDPECRITCPILRAYDCPICHSGGGDRAHTVRYCPQNKAGMQAKIERMLSGSTDTVRNWCSTRVGQSDSAEAKRGRKKRRFCDK